MPFSPPVLIYSDLGINLLCDKTGKYLLARVRCAIRERDYIYCVYDQAAHEKQEQEEEEEGKLFTIKLLFIYYLVVGLRNWNACQMHDMRISSSIPMVHTHTQHSCQCNCDFIVFRLTFLSFLFLVFISCSRKFN